MSEIINAVDLTSKLIRCESITPNSAGAIELLISYLEPLGFKCKKLILVKVLKK
jgi:acetylornithine deacetylase/succinyl-diaminopimelate desuccinylase-like protein